MTTSLKTLGLSAIQKKGIGEHIELMLKSGKTIEAILTTLKDPMIKDNDAVNAIIDNQLYHSDQPSSQKISLDTSGIPSLIRRLNINGSIICAEPSSRKHYVSQLEDILRKQLKYGAHSFDLLYDAVLKPVFLEYICSDYPNQKQKWDDSPHWNGYLIDIILQLGKYCDSQKIYEAIVTMNKSPNSNTVSSDGHYSNKVILGVLGESLTYFDTETLQPWFALDGDDFLMRIREGRYSESITQWIESCVVGTPFGKVILPRQWKQFTDKLDQLDVNTLHHNNQWYLKTIRLEVSKIHSGEEIDKRCRYGGYAYLLRGK